MNLDGSFYWRQPGGMLQRYDSGDAIAAASMLVGAADFPF